MRWGGVISFPTPGSALGLGLKRGLRHIFNRLLFRIPGMPRHGSLGESELVSLTNLQ